ncbi:MAG: hypothetical protein OXH61_10460 [Acidimicrobiaceae bacterium]|nr:hypothetical protein [Acidimicrobiaceae bacterium]
MAAAALATVLLAASCGGDQDSSSRGVATLVGVEPLETDTLITAAPTPEATISDSEAGAVPAATADQSSEPEIRTVGEEFSQGAAAEEAAAPAVDPEPAETEAEAAETDPEQALLNFAQCMRENGLPDFVDPTVDATGTVQWSQMFAESGIDPASDDFQQGLDVCRHHFEGLAFGGDGGGFNVTEVQDTLLGFAQCLRAEGIQVDDPVLARLVTGDGDSPGERLFGPAFDPTNPDVQAAIGVCQGELGGLGGGGAQAGGNQ